MNERNERKLTENINDLDSTVSSCQDLASYADIEAENNPTDEIKERAR